MLGLPVLNSRGARQEGHSDPPLLISALSLTSLSVSHLREGALSYGRHIGRLFLELVAAVLETLGLDSEAADGIMGDLKDGTQVMVANFFPPCPEPDLTLGMPPHSDFGFLTLLHQDGVGGLQIQHEGHWVTVDPVAGALVVNVGDHLEVAFYSPLSYFPPFPSLFLYINIYTAVNHKVD